MKAFQRLLEPLIGLNILSGVVLKALPGNPAACSDTAAEQPAKQVKQSQSSTFQKLRVPF